MADNVIIPELTRKMEAVMKKYVCRLMVLAVMLLAMCAEGFADVEINEANFPDEKFRSYVSSIFDTNRDGSLSSAEIANATRIDVSNSSISSLKGVEYFTALTELSCYYSQLTALDVSNNTALTRLVCYENQLTALDVSKNTALTELWCHGNQLTALDVSKNTALTNLYCEENQLTSLDVSSNTALTGLVCYKNQLTALDVSNNTALTHLACNSNQLTALDVSKNTALTYLACNSNQLTAIDVSKNTALTRLFCYSNQLTSLDLSKNTALTRLECFDNQLTALDVSKNTALLELYCHSNQLTALDLSKNTALTTLWCYTNQLTILDLSNNTNLANLRCDFTITSADNNFEFNIADFLKAYKSLDNNLRSIDFLYVYTGGRGSLTLAPDIIAANNIVSFTIPEGKTFGCIYMTLTYSNSSNKTVYVIPFGSSAGITDPDNPYDPNDPNNPDSSDIAPIITTADLPDGAEGSSYSSTLSALGSTPITWTLVSGDFPAGLTLDSDGSLSGIPTTPGVYSFIVQAANSAGSDSKLFTIIVPFSEVRPPKITTSSLTDGCTNSPYGFKFQAAGTSTGLTSLTWSADERLPEGFTLSTSGYLSGTTSQDGTYTLTVQVSNSQGTDSADFTLRISASPSNTPPEIITETAEPSASGQAYTCQLMASGTPPFTWTLAKGKLPEGLKLDSSGLITGKTTKVGTKRFTVIVSNDYGTDKKKIALTGYKLPVIKTTSLKDATVAKKYSAAIKKQGSRPLTWELEGTLPQDISFNDKTGKISGKPAVNDKGMIRVTLSNPVGELSKVYILKVNAIVPKVSPNSLKKGTYGKKYSENIKLKGTAPISVIISGDLPEDLSFDAEKNRITGTPAETCTNRPITIIAANMGGVTQKTYTLTVNAVAPKITTKSLPEAVQGSAYNVDFEATGTPSITWSATGLPSGLSMSSTGTISGTPTKAGKFTVKVSAANSAKTVKKSYKLIVTASTTQKARETQEVAETSRNISRNESARQSEDTYAVIPTHEVNAFEGDNAVLSGEYIVIAELGTISVDESGMYDFTVTLSDDVHVGRELMYLAGSSEPSEDNAIAEFSDETGEEVSVVPESREVTVSVWLNKDITYTPSLAVRR